jgi:hypothetical protein
MFLPEREILVIADWLEPLSQQSHHFFQNATIATINLDRFDIPILLRSRCTLDNLIFERYRYAILFEFRSPALKIGADASLLDHSNSLK